MKIKLSQYAKLHNITYKTAIHWFKNNLIEDECYTSPSGSLFVIIKPKNEISNKPAYTYARVSSHNKKEDLSRQHQRCLDFAQLNGYSVSKSFKEVGSGMNDNRTQLVKLLNQPIGTIIVENKDRLTRFGFNYINTLYTKLGGNIIVINNENNDENDLMKDLVSVITSFCCRLYGMRRGYNKARNIKEEIDK